MGVGHWFGTILGGMRNEEELNKIHGEGIQLGMEGLGVSKSQQSGWAVLGGRLRLDTFTRTDGDGSLGSSTFDTVPSFPFHSFLFTDLLLGPVLGNVTLHRGC